MTATAATETVEWHTWSGRLHKFGPFRTPCCRWAVPCRVAQCNRSIVADEQTQSRVKQTAICKRCFPGVSS